MFILMYVSHFLIFLLTLFNFPRFIHPLSAQIFLFPLPVFFEGRESEPTKNNKDAASK